MCWRSSRRRSASPTGIAPPDGAAVDRGLAWLAKHQDADGRWDCDGFMKHDGASDRCDGAGRPAYDVGATALALLAFLGDGNSVRSGEHRDVVKRAVVWLRKQQQWSVCVAKRPKRSIAS